MKLFMTTLLAAAMFVPAAHASDNLAEQRFKAKMGRYSPAEEARRNGAKEDAHQCGGRSCCHRSHASHGETATVAGQTRELLREKLGRGGAGGSHSDTAVTAAESSTHACCG